MDEWKACDITSFLKVFKSYQEDGWAILKGCMQWNPVYSWIDFHLQQDLDSRTLDQWARA